MSGVHGTRLIVIVGGATDPAAAAAELLPAFGDGPVVVSPAAADLDDASAVTQAALSGLRAAAGWPAAPRPVSADDLLPERVLSGDAEARATLIANVYEPLANAGDVLLDTTRAFLDTGGVLESTARALFVHANTVRYRLRRVAEVSGETPTDARGAFTLRVALAVGAIEQLG